MYSFDKSNIQLLEFLLFDSRIKLNRFYYVNNSLKISCIERPDYSESKIKRIIFNFTIVKTIISNLTIIGLNSYDINIKNSRKLEDIQNEVYDIYSIDFQEKFNVIVIETIFFSISISLNNNFQIILHDIEKIDETFLRIFGKLKYSFEDWNIEYKMSKNLIEN